jgi:hypothetical protein
MSTDACPFFSTSMPSFRLMNGAQFLRGVDNTPNGVIETKPYNNNQNFGWFSLQGESDG